jgi:hypothetical protein
LRRGDGVYLTRLNDKKARKIFASRIPHKLHLDCLTRVLDLRMIREQTKNNEDLKYLVVSVKDTGIELDVS